MLETDKLHPLAVENTDLRARLEQAEKRVRGWLQAYEAAERERDEARDDRKRMIQHVAAMGHAITSSDPDYANDSWRSLPEHLQAEIASEEEHIDVLESGEGD